MWNHLALGLGLVGALALAGCDRGEPARTATPGAEGPAAEAQTGTGGGPSGQTPAYGEPGGAPSQATSQGDAAGPSIGEDSPPPR